MASKWRHFFVSFLFENFVSFSPYSRYSENVTLSYFSSFIVPSQKKIQRQKRESKKWRSWENWVPMRLISVNLGRNCLLADPFEGEGRCMSWDPMGVRKVPSFPHPQEEALTTSLHISLGSSSSCERQVHNSSALVVLERPIYPPWKTRSSSLF